MSGKTVVETLTKPRYNKIRQRERVEIEDLKTTAKNKKFIRNFIDGYLKAKKLTKYTIYRHYYCLTKLIAVWDETLDFDKATREEVMIAIGKINDSKLADETKRKIAITTKLFWKFMTDPDDETYPRQVSWIKTTVNRESKLKPSDLITYDEFISMADAVRNLRDRSILFCLYCQGVRCGELVGMSVNSVQIDKGIMTVDGKTGQRTIPISPMCLPVLSQYMDTMKDAEPTDPLWLAQGTWINKKVGIDYSSVRKMLKEAAKRAGIKKRIYPHLFRHTRASIYYGSNKLSSVQLRMFMGWSKRSNVGETTYAHLTPENLIEAVNNADGKTTNKPKENPVDKVCAICGTANPLTSTLCSNPKCGNNLDKPVLNYNKNVEDFKELVVESLKDPKLFEEVMHNYLVQQRKKKLR